MCTVGFLRQIGPRTTEKRRRHEKCVRLNLTNDVAQMNQRELVDMLFADVEKVLKGIQRDFAKMVAYSMSKKSKPKKE